MRTKVADRIVRKAQQWLVEDHLATEGDVVHPPNEITKYRPAYFTGFERDDDLAQFSTLNELLAIPFVKSFREHGWEDRAGIEQPFYGYSTGGGMLWAHYGSDGGMCWGVGRLRDPCNMLPPWKAKWPAKIAP